MIEWEQSTSYYAGIDQTGNFNTCRHYHTHFFGQLYQLEFFFFLENDY